MGKKEKLIVIISALIFSFLFTQLFVGEKENKKEKINEKKTISIISDRSDFHLALLVKKFEQEKGVKINITSIDKGLLSYIQKKNTADIFISKNSSEILKASNLGLLGKIPSNITINIQKDYKGKDWYNMSSRIRAFYIKKGIKDYPKTYEELALPKYKGQICIRPLSHNYNVEMVSYMLVKHGEKYTKEWLNNLNLNLARKPSGNDRAQIKAIVEDGICNISIGNTYYMGLMLEDLEQREWANNVNLFIPNQGSNDGGSISLYSAIGINKNSIDKKEVLDFLSFTLDELNQQFLSSTNYEFPIIGHSNSKMVKSFTSFQGIDLEDIKHTSITQKEITKIREKALMLIKEIENNIK